MEDAVGGHEGLESMGLEEMESLWQQVKKNTEKERHEKRHHKKGGAS